ncbi:MAG TPA: amidohydrolase family protein, partial [Opitutus sp.]|nr:amidohydrolase family protein [Opitutus sp.]
QTALRRDFLPADLEREIGAAGIEGVISVQARQTLEETRWLLDLAREHAFIRGVVGWVPLVAPDVGETLATLAASEPKLRSVRHVLQGEPNGYMLGEAFNQGLARLASLNLVYDLLVFERQLPEAITLVDRHPSQRFVLDHIAKPRIAAGEFEPWARNIRDLARRPNVYCKLSGMVTEADRTSWSDSQLRPYFDHVVSCFGPSRLMFGSDWPVCLDVCDYARWRQMVGRWTNLLTADEQARIFGETAVEAYRL